MANAVVFDYFPELAGTIEQPATRGPFTSSGLVLFQRQTLPTDPIGTCTRAFDGVNAGSEIRVYDPDGNELAGIESCDADHTLSWDVYAAGSANNTVRIVIVNFSYKIKEFTYTSSVGSSSIPVQQEIDKWALNPA